MLRRLVHVMFIRYCFYFLFLRQYRRRLLFEGKPFSVGNHVFIWRHIVRVRRTRTGHARIYVYIFSRYSQSNKQYFAAVFVFDPRRIVYRLGFARKSTTTEMLIWTRIKDFHSHVKTRWTRTGTDPLTRNWPTTQPWTNSPA